MNLGRRLGDSSSSPYALPSPPSGRGWRRYQEVVTARPGPGRYTIYLKSDPLGLGMRGMGSLGVSAPQIVGSTAPIAAAGAGAAATAGMRRTSSLPLARSVRLKRDTRLPDGTFCTGARFCSPRRDAIGGSLALCRWHLELQATHKSNK